MCVFDCDLNENLLDFQYHFGTSDSQPFEQQNELYMPRPSEYTLNLYD